jgi:hypothetical protein
LREKAKGKGEGKVSIMEVFCMHVWKKKNKTCSSCF